MKIYIKIISFLVVILFCYCSTQKHTTDRSLIFEKIESHFGRNQFESQWSTYKVSISLKNDESLHFPINALSKTCYFKVVKSDSIYQSEINNLKDIYKKNPVFVIENKKGQMKYFLKNRELLNPIIYKGSKLIEPLRFEINSCPGFGIIAEKYSKFKKGNNYICDYNIYDFDLKINENDSIVRLIYVYKDKYIYSNWISLY